MNNMTYKIKENAKNVWIRNNENTQDLSPLTDANSVYFNNGRTLEQELGKGAMESNVVTIDSTMSKVIDEAYDGVYESCVFKGRSLVNLVEKPTSANVGSGKKWNAYGGGTPSKTFIENGVRLANTQLGSIVLDYFDLSLFKPNTEYTLFIDVYHNGEGTPPVLDKIAGTGQYAIPLKNGHNCIVFTTISDLTSANMGIRFGYAGSASESCVYEFSNIIIIEGDHSSIDPDYFKGLRDSKMPVLTTTGKNLVGKLMYGSVSTGGNIADNMNQKRVRTDYINIQNEEKITIKTHSGEVNQNISFFYDENKKFISQTSWNPSITNSNGLTILIPSNAKYVICEFTHNLPSDKDLVLSNIKVQIEKGDTATFYEPFKSNILSTPEEVVLRGNSDTQDTYNTLTGEYIQRVGEIVLDGTDSTHVWNRNDEWSAGDIAVFWSSNVVNMSGNFILCDKFLTLQKDDLIVDNVCVQEGVRYGATFIQISIKKSKLSSPDVTGFKKWLQSNPITVQYELAEPVTTVIEPSTIPFIYQNGHIILESGYKGQSLTPILEYTASVSRTGQVENVAKTIQRHETQLTLLEKMLIGNIIELDYNNTLMALNLKMDEVK